MNVENHAFDEEEYKALLEQESAFWGFKAEAQYELGIPWEIDRKNATRIEGSSANSWLSSSDPLVHELWRGEFLDSVLSTARSSGSRVLELGCSTGWLSLDLARTGMNVTAIDISEKSIEIAKQYLATYNPLSPGVGSIDYQVQDLNTIVLPKEVYDCIISFSTFHHIPEIERLILECHKALHPGGLLIVTDHLREGRRNEILNAIIALLLLPIPACYSYRRRVKDILSLLFRGVAGQNVYNNVKKYYKQRRQTTEWHPDESPFEEVTGYETVEYIYKYFKVEEFTYRKSFRGRRIVSDLRLGDGSKRFLTKFLRRIDNFFCKTGLIPGMGAYIVARKI